VREVVPPPPPDTQPYSTPSAPAAGGTDYVVIRGDSFSTIADRFGVTVKAIQNANPAIDPRRIQIGQKIFVPAAAPKPVQPAATALAAGGKVHQVKSGDTLWEIASKNGTTVKELRSANNLTTDRIVVGQELVIP
jgi:LysM repeat protein